MKPVMIRWGGAGLVLGMLVLGIAKAQSPDGAGVTSGAAAGQGPAGDDGKRQAAIRYRVLTVEELFKWDKELAIKADQIGISSTYSDGSQYQHGEIRRIDMDAEDFELALNRMASQGWRLVAVTKGNYWVFSK